MDALNSGDTAWILTSTALVLLMTMPGLALFYGGLVRSRNVLSVLMHCFSVCALASILWLICGYSLAFGDGGANKFIIGGPKILYQLFELIEKFYLTRIYGKFNCDNKFDLQKINDQMTLEKKIESDSTCHFEIWKR